MSTTSFRKLAKGKNKEIGFLSLPKMEKGRERPFSKWMAVRSLGLDLADLLPATALTGVEDGLAYILGFKGIPEVRAQWAFLP